jgi:hypothetical protein
VLQGTAAEGDQIAEIPSKNAEKVITVSPLNECTSELKEHQDSLPFPPY